MVKANLKDLPGAIADTTLAVRINPRNVEAYCNRAAYKADMGDHQGAVADCTAALAIRPNDRNAYFSRGTSKVCLLDYTAPWPISTWR